MRESHVVLLAGLTLASVALLTAVYVFALGNVATWLASQWWGAVLAATCVAAIALLAPVFIALAIVSRRGPVAQEDEEGGATELDFEVITGAAQDSIIIADATGTIISCNRMTEAMFGYAAEEMFGRAVTMLMPERYREAHAKGLRRVSAGGDAHLIGRTVELHGLRDEGQEFPLELSLSHWGTERQHGYLGIIRDMTEHKQREEALRRSEERLRRLVETAPDAVVVIDASGKIVAWNPRAHDIFGYEEDEAIGANVTMLMPVRYRNRHELGMARQRETGRGDLIGKTVDLHGQRKDGREFPLELSLGTWSAGKETFFSAIIRDASEPKPTDQGLERQPGTSETRG